MIYKKIDETKKAKLLKNLGTVYAIKTSKGYAIGQIADIEERLGLYICRIFSKLYDNIPTEVEDIVEKKEDYILIVNLPSMAHWRIKQAIVIGKYAIPSNYENPKYTKCNTTRMGVLGPMKFWHIIPNYLPLCEFIPLDEWIKNVLNKSIKDSSWKVDFKNLNNSSIVNGSYLVEMLENGWSLSSWLPSDFDASTTQLINDR